MFFASLIDAWDGGLMQVGKTHNFSFPIPHLFSQSGYIWEIWEFILSHWYARTSFVNALAPHANLFVILRPRYPPQEVRGTQSQ